MTNKQVSSSQIYALQAIFTLAYAAGVALIICFIVGAFLLADWALSFMVIDLFSALSITIDSNIVSSVIALILIAFPVLKSFNKLKAQLIKYWLMVVNIKSINS
jgi:hypothetical protein